MAEVLLRAEKTAEKVAIAKYFGTIQIQNKIYFYDLQTVKRFVGGMWLLVRHHTLPPPHGPGCGGLGGGGQVIFCRALALHCTLCNSAASPHITRMI